MKTNKKQLIHASEAKNQQTTSNLEQYFRPIATIARRINDMTPAIRSNKQTTQENRTQSSNNERLPPPLKTYKQTYKDFIKHCRTIRS